MKDGRSIHLKSYDYITLSKDFRGLGIKQLQFTHLDLMAKNLFQFTVISPPLWVMILVSKYSLP